MGDSLAEVMRNIYGPICMAGGPVLVFFGSMHFGAPWWAAIFLAMLFGTIAALPLLGVCMGIDWLLTRFK